jgi:hypothetical protein
MTQPRQRGAERGRERLLARQRSQTLRQGYDDMHADASEAQPEAAFAGTERLHRLRPKPTVLSRLLGARPALVPVQLVEVDGRVEVRVRARPRSAAAQEALAELADLLRHVFQAEPSPLTPDERRRLLGGEQATVGERLVLLTRLAIAANTTIATAAVPFAPDNRGLNRYLGKFAALPDGLPFSLRLLLKDLRGRKPSPKERDPQKAADARFLALPESVLLLSVRRTLDRERQFDQEWSDYDLGPQLQTTLQSLGVHLERAPGEKAVGRLRARWVRHGLSLFPNAPERRRARGNAHEPG